jgi:hypothetical protein
MKLLGKNRAVPTLTISGLQIPKLFVSMAKCKFRMSLKLFRLTSTSEKAEIHKKVIIQRDLALSHSSVSLILSKYLAPLEFSDKSWELKICKFSPNYFDF